MKKVIILLFLFTFFIVFYAHPILITEFMADPNGTEPANEWIEIYNPTNTAYCLDGWKVGDQEGQWIIPDPTADDDYILYPGGYVTFANNADSFLAKYGYEPDLANVIGSTSAIQVTVSGSVYLANTSDQVYLRNPGDTIMDCVQWGTTYETGSDSIWYPLSGPAGSEDPFIRNPQDAEGTELNGEVSEQLGESFVLASTINESFEGPNTGGFDPSGASGIRINNLIHNPTSPTALDTVQISCKIKSDTTLTNVWLIYTIDNFVSTDTSNMNVINDTLFYDTILPYAIGTRVKYYVCAINIRGDTATSPLDAPTNYKEYIVSDGSNVYEVHFNKSVDNSWAVLNFAIGNDSLDWHMAKYIGQATKSIDACLYDLDRQIVTDSLISAYNKGVSVRFITDADNRATTQTQQLEAAGITVIDDTFPVGYAGGNIMHNKFIIIDTQMVFSGSYNVTDNGTVLNANNSILIKDVLLAENYTKEFVEMWGSSTMTPDANNSKFSTSKTDNINHIFYIDEDTIELYMSPSDGCASKIINAITTADKSIYFCIFVFSSQTIADAMKTRYDGGVIVRGVFDATYWNADYSKSLDLRGLWNSTSSNNPWSPPADVYVDSVNGNLLHHKYMLIDADDWTSNPIVITGSYNWSTNAETGNDENLLIIHSKYFADLFLQEFAARYYEAGGEDTVGFSINTNINNVNLAIYRENSNVIINYNIVSNDYKYIFIEFKDKTIFSSNDMFGTYIHNNTDGGEYILYGIKNNGSRVLLAKSIIDKYNNNFSVISDNKLFGSKRPYKAMINGNGILSIDIYNIAGEKVFSSKTNINGSKFFVLDKKLSSGIYVVNYSINNMLIKEKIIKVR